MTVLWGCLAVNPSLLSLKDHDETAPPFRSLGDDDGDANQCKQS